MTSGAEHRDRTLLAAGREAEVYLEADGTALKLFFSPDDAARCEQEFTRSRALHAAGHPVPEVFGETVVDGRPGILMQRLEGADLLGTLERHPQQLLTAGRVLAETHVAMHDGTAPDSLPDLVPHLATNIANAPRLTEPQRARMLEELARLPAGDAVCHGDYHLGNMLGTWDDVRVIDWGGATRGNPLADVARTELLARTAVLPPDMSRWFQVVARFGRGVLISRYLTHYSRHRDLDRALLARWFVVCAAARLSEGIDEENDVLAGLVATWCDQHPS
jgi:aminoglycoside phosphotransferase (APT) family kinase protein